MSSDERPDLFERLQVFGEHLDAERHAAGDALAVPVERHPVQRHPVERPPVRRSRVPLVAAAAVTVVGLAAIAQLDPVREPAPQLAAPTPTVTTSTDAATPEPSAVTEPLPATEAATSEPPPATETPMGDTASAPVAAPDQISWSRVTDIGSIARSSVDQAVAGPAGFVAVGMGFDDGRNQGRVWHSTDGVVWNEPALDLFEAKSVFGVTATADAYLVLAGTNPDRLGLGEGEGSPDVGLFRSTDGQHWEPWGELWREFGLVTSTGDVLLRSPTPGVIEWSADGANWVAATFADGLDDDAWFDIFGGVVPADEGTYLRGFTSGGFAVWFSADGRRWQQMPSPPAGGSMAPVRGGIVAMADPMEDECNDRVDRLFRDGTPDSREAALDLQWTCASEPDVYRFDRESGAWSLTPDHPGATPGVPPLVRLGNTLVAALTEPTKELTIWTAAADTLEWTAQPSPRLPYISDTGGPGMATTAASDDTVVVFSEDRLVDGETALIVGKLDTAP